LVSREAHPDARSDKCGKDLRACFGVERGVVVTSEGFEATLYFVFVRASRRKRIEGISKVFGQPIELSRCDARAFKVTHCEFEA
jgi:hypothetical protein